MPINIGNPVEHTIDGISIFYFFLQHYLIQYLMFIEFAQIIKSIVNGDSPVQYLPAVEDDPQRRRPDISRAKKYLNWEPKVMACFSFILTSTHKIHLKVLLEVGLRKTVEYFRRELLRSSGPTIVERSSVEEEKDLW